MNMNRHLALVILILAFCDVRAEEDAAPSAGLFAIELDLPAEPIQDLTLTLDLHPGIIYQCRSLRIRGAPSAASESIRGPNNGQMETSVIWHLGNIDNALDEDIRLEFDLTLADFSQNQAGMAISPCLATIRWKDERGVIHTASGRSEEITVVEPNLVLERGIEALDQADELTTLCFYHSRDSSASAHEVQLTERLALSREYVPGSMKVLSGPPSEMQVSGGGTLKWVFSEVDLTWGESQKVEVQYLSQIAPFNGTEPSLSCSSLGYTSAAGNPPEERVYLSNSCSAGEVSAKGSSLEIDISPELESISPGDVLNYTVIYQCHNTDAADVAIRVFFPPESVFSYARPPPDSGTNDLWTIGNLSAGDGGQIQIETRVNRSATAGEVLESRAEIASAGVVQDRASCVAQIQGAALLHLEQEASCDLLSPGGFLNYTITVANRGAQPATNISIENTLESRLDFSPSSGASPDPSEIWQDAQGTHLRWDSQTLNGSELGPGESRSVKLQVSLPYTAEASEGSIINLCRFSSDQASGESQLETMLVQSLYVRKRAEKDSCPSGGLVNYTIFYGNELDVSARDAVLIDVLPEGAEYVDARPRPDHVQGRILEWHLGTLTAHVRGSISLWARVSEQPDAIFQEDQRIFGQGFASSYQKLSAKSGPAVLTNHANITALIEEEARQDFSSAQVLVQDAAGTELEASQRGSGRISREERIDYRAKEGRIEVRERLSADFLDVDMGLASFKWPWSSHLKASNLVRDERMEERSLYVNEMEVSRNLLMDKNQTSFSCKDRLVNGTSDWTYLHPQTGGRDSSTEIYEDYHGTFSREWSIDSYGQGLRYDRKSSGKGFSSWDQKLSTGRSGAELLSSGHGSGSFSFLEEAGREPYLHENMSLVFGKSNQSAGSLTAIYSSKWSHSTALRNPALGSGARVGARYADFSRYESLADRQSLSWSGSFAGAGSIEAFVKETSLQEEIDLEESFWGEYQMNMALGIHDLPEFLGPHLSVSHNACWSDEKTVQFSINVTNDGNRTLAPVEITVALPEGLSFTNSSLRPQIGGRNLSWSWLSLPIGNTCTIELYARWDGLQPLQPCQILARGGYGGRWTESSYSCPAGKFRSPPELATDGGKTEAGFSAGMWRPPPCMQIGMNLSSCLEDRNWEDDWISEGVNCRCIN